MVGCETVMAPKANVNEPASPIAGPRKNQGQGNQKTGCSVNAPAKATSSPMRNRSVTMLHMTGDHQNQAEAPVEASQAQTNPKNSPRGNAMKNLLRAGNNGFIGRLG